MSCGKPHDVPCSDILAQVYAYLDGELDLASCDEVQEHLDECGPCLREYGLEESVKKLVAKHCGHDPVPGELRGKVLARIQEIRADITDTSGPPAYPDPREYPDRRAR